MLQIPLSILPFCDASTLFCLTLKVTTRNASDPSDPEETFASIQQETNYYLLKKFVLEMCQKYNNTFRAVNMYNYHISPAILVLLRNRGIYARGTVKKNRRMVPSQTLLTKADCKKMADGYVRMAVCEFAKMQYFGWNDNNPVYILSAAYSSQERTTFWRQRVAAKLQIIPMYNDGMQGVDRHNQLRSKFALASRRGLKRYYVTHQLAQVDIGITNVAIYFSLAHPHLKNKEGQRRKFNEDIALQFIAANSLDWQSLYGNFVLDAINYGATHTPGDSDDEDVFDHLGVPNRS
jgi:hypothetical protein